MDNQNEEILDSSGGSMNEFTGTPETLPNATAVLVLGIVSIPTCFCYGIVGLACGIIALVLAGKAKALYQGNPSRFSIASFKNMKAGRICALIGTSLSAIYLIIIVVYVFILGISLSELSEMNFPQ